MEVESYRYAKEKEYDVSKYSVKKKIPMKDLFDMIAGTSTGGLLTTALVTPTKEDKTEAFYSDKLISIFVDKGPEIFKT